MLIKKVYCMFTLFIAVFLQNDNNNSSDKNVAGQTGWPVYVLKYIVALN